MGRAMLRKSLIQFSVDGWGCVPSLLFDLKPNYGGGNEDNDGGNKDNLLRKLPRRHCYTQRPQPCSKPPPTHTSARDSWTLTGKSGPVSHWVTGSFLLGPGALKFLSVPSKSVSPVLCKFWGLYGGVNGDLLQEGLCHTQVYCTQSPCSCGSPLLTHTSSRDTQTQ